MPDLFVSRILSLFWILIILAGLYGAVPRPSTAESIDPAQNAPNLPLVNPQPNEIQKKQTITDTTIKTEMSKQRVRDLKIQVPTNGPSICLHPQTIDLTVLGPTFDPSQNNNLKKNISAYIRVNKTKPGLYARPARIILPQGYVLVEATPQVFIVEIKSTKNTTP